MKSLTGDNPLCSNVAEHTYGPSGYLAWHEWAERMASTHTQSKCPGCGLYLIWNPSPVSAPGEHLDSKETK